MIEQQLDIPTRDGATTTFIVHPERGGPHPVIVFYMDAPAIREELRDMCRRLASVGYYVVLPNLYYRSGVLELGPLADEAARTRMFELMGSLDIPKIMSDTEALIAFVDADPAARAGSIGTVGYCMSGQYAVSAAVQFPGRVTAAASVYGVQLVTERDDSPHLAAGRTKAELYFGCAQTDRWAPLEMVEQLREAMASSGAKAEVELYPGVEHGFAFPQRAAYDRNAAERHWERLFAFFARRL
ncbi:MAG TPA: dienelactone hydrolase family protein [Caulobacteraceae bacterium]|jgi:carboxymethylenebutenolidase|nr:dienelactone hydrolase family protein [Caulobacteraceae bacterium]